MLRKCSSALAHKFLFYLMSGSIIYLLFVCEPDIRGKEIYCAAALVTVTSHTDADTSCRFFASVCKGSDCE